MTAIPTLSTPVATVRRASIETDKYIPVEALPIGPRQDGKIVSGYKTTAFQSLYGPNGQENVIWSDYFEKISAVCG